MAARRDHGQPAPALEGREARIRAREEAADARESEVDSREVAVARREEALRARTEAEDIRRERELLLVQMREANERLVVATIHADELAAAAAYDEQRFRSLVTASSAVVWQADPSGNIRVDVGSWRAFTGTDPGTLDAELGWLAAVHPEDRDHVAAAWRHAITTTSPFASRHRLVHHDGGHAWVLARAVPVPSSGPVREWIGMSIDVTDLVRIEEARDRFIGILGHDLRTPLTALSIGFEFLATLPEPYAGLVTKMQQSVRRMKVIVRDLMDFARSRLSGGIPVTPAMCDLRRIASIVSAEMRQAYPGRDIALEALGDLRGECDADRVEQVLSNLIDNAVAHGTDPIRVRLAEDGDEIVLTVRNQGPPIPGELMPRLFEPFARGTPGGRPGDGTDGLGLGLYIANEVVRSHGGTIGVTSDADHGTVFTIRWPRSARDPELR